VLNLSRSNFFEYKENIHALYLNYNRQFKGFMIQAGLRMENTQSQGDSYPLFSDGSVDKDNRQSFSRSYTNFFPSGAISFNKNPESQLNVTYSRRIDRPAYQDLNPFEFKLDEYTFQKGNTELKPQYTNSFGITHSCKYKLNTSLNYSKVKDVLAQLVDTTEKSKSFLVKKNMATQNIISFNINYPFAWKWYSLFANLNTYYSHYKANFGPGRTIDLDVYVFNVYMQHSVNLGKGWKGEISGWYVSPSMWQGFSRSSKMWSMDAGLQKIILNGAGICKISVSDIFQTMRWKGASDFARQHNISSGGWESRLLKLNFSWRFGNTQVKANRERRTGVEDENKRVQQESNNQNRQ
jgi:iron complex outermembrane recepter protein